MKIVRPILLRLTLVLAVLATTGALFAHEGHHHTALGTVKAISATQLDLATTEGTLKSFVLTETTSYLRGDTPIHREEITVGERAAVMYEEKAGKYDAAEVKLAPKS